ncbi:hypothetical protein FOCC_FOCC009101, partial [Frankliniella occidentalis]
MRRGSLEPGVMPPGLPETAPTKFHNSVSRDTENCIQRYLILYLLQKLVKFTEFCNILIRLQNFVPMLHVSISREPDTEFCIKFD